MLYNIHVPDIFFARHTYCCFKDAIIMIHLQNVSKVYPNGTEALKNISLDIEQGEFVFIVGPSGAGKSTFLKLLIHEETASFGKISVNGYDMMKIKKRKVPYLRRTMGIVFQDFRLIDKMNVYDNIAFAMRAIGRPEKSIKKRVEYVIDVVGLNGKEKCRPNELSGGEQQRVSLARALVNNPEIIIADEPTGNVDPELSHEIIELLNEINAMGTTVLVVTHEHELVREFHQRVVTIDKGKVIGDTRNGRFAVGASDDYAEEYSDEDYAEQGYIDDGYSEEGYAHHFVGYEEDIDLTDDELTDNYEGLGYDDDADAYDGAYEPQYPDNVVVLPDDDDRLG